MTRWQTGDHVQDARTGARGEVIDGMAGYRPRVQWPNGRILRVEADELRPARCESCRGQLPPYHDSVYLAFCQIREHWRAQGVPAVDLTDLTVREWIDTVRP